MMKIPYKVDRIVVICAILAGALGALYAFLTPPVYKATFQISVEGGNLAKNTSGDIDSWQSYVEAQCAVIKTKELADKVIDKLHLRLSKKFATQDPASILQKAVKTDHPKGTNIVNINVYMDSPELAAKIAQALAQSYLAEKDQKKFALSKEAAAWFKEATDASRKITESQAALDKFVAENKIESFKEDLQKASGDLEELTAQREEGGALVKNIEKRLSEIQEALKSDDDEEIFAALKDNQGLMQLKSMKNEIKAKLVKMSNLYQESYPAMVKLNEDLRAVNKNIKAIIDETVKVGNASLEAAKEKIASLDKNLPEAAARVENLKALEPKMEEMERRLEISQKFYNEVLARLKDGNFSFVELTSMGLAGQLDPRTMFVGPNKILYTLLGLVIGSLLGLVISFILKNRSKSAKIEAVKKILKEPLIPAVLLAVSLLAPAAALADVELQRAGSAKKNFRGGYDFYDSAGRKTGSSETNRRGGYNYYDTRGNIVGSMRKDGESSRSYTYRDSYGIRKGVLKKGPSGEYTYKDTQSGKLVNSIPQVQSDLGSLSPDVFQDQNR